MGANLANEVADEKFCETTIGVKDAKMAPILRDLFQTPNFRVVVSDDVDAVEICGALKNIVACGAGFVDGLGLGDNTKAAVIRLGLMEMIKFVDVFYPGSKLATFFESCGVADLITTCYGGRNRKCSEAFVKTGKSIAELEKEMLNGQKLQVKIAKATKLREPELFILGSNHCRRSEPHVEDQEHGRQISTLHRYSQNLHGTDQAKSVDRLYSIPPRAHVSFCKYEKSIRIPLFLERSKFSCFRNKKRFFIICAYSF